MTTLLPENSPVIALKAKFTPKHHRFPEKPLQEWIEKETESQLTAPRQKHLTTEIVSRKELSNHGENINTIRKRIENKYQNQLNPPISVEESIWRYVCSEYPSNSIEDKKQVYKNLAQTVSSVIPHEFDFVRSGKEYEIVASRKLPSKEASLKTKELIEKINKSKNIPNAISTIANFVEKKSDEGTILSLDDNRFWLQLDLYLPSVWDSSFVLENPPHVLFNQSSIRVGVICIDDNSKDQVQENVIYDQQYSFQFLTFTELKRNFIQGPRFKALVQSYDIVLIDTEVFEQLRILKLSEYSNLFPIDFSLGRAEYERIMNSITFRVIDSKERLRIDFGLQTWETKQLVDNCKFVIEKLGTHAPWGFDNIRALYINCGSAPQLCIYKHATAEVEGKLFKKSKGLIPDSLKNVTQFIASRKDVEELEEIEELPEEASESSEEEAPIEKNDQVNGKNGKDKQEKNVKISNNSTDSKKRKRNEDKVEKSKKSKTK